MLRHILSKQDLTRLYLLERPLDHLSGETFGVPRPRPIKQDRGADSFVGTARQKLQDPSLYPLSGKQCLPGPVKVRTHDHGQFVCDPAVARTYQVRNHVNQNAVGLPRQRCAAIRPPRNPQSNHDIGSVCPCLFTQRKRRSASVWNFAFPAIDFLLVLRYGRGFDRSQSWHVGYFKIAVQANVYAIEK